MLSIALPKGRLGNAAYGSLAKAGYLCADMEEASSSRKLVIEDAERGVRYFLVKPSDTAVYVERGVADIGIVGRDILRETSPDVNCLLDLPIGKCRLAVAAKKDWVDDRSLPLRVATTYPNCAREFFSSSGRAIDIIVLHGSVELAPLLGLSDVIVDVVETGTTLRENGLVVFNEIFESNAVLIANRSNYLFKRKEIDALVKKMEALR